MKLSWVSLLGRWSRGFLFLSVELSFVLYFKKKKIEGEDEDEEEEMDTVAKGKWIHIQERKIGLLMFFLLPIFLWFSFHFQMGIYLFFTGTQEYERV